MIITLSIGRILISMVISVVLGFIWYGPLFGKAWVKLSGIKVPKKKPCFKDMLPAIIISLVGALFLSLCLTFSIAYASFIMGRSGVIMGIQAAFWNWLGFMVPLQLAFVAWEGKPWKLFGIHAGYWLAFILLSGIILTI
jgi:hypothetical protein